MKKLWTEGRAPVRVCKFPHQQRSHPVIANNYNAWYTIIIEFVHRRNTDPVVNSYVCLFFRNTNTQQHSRLEGSKNLLKGFLGTEHHVLFRRILSRCNSCYHGLPLDAESGHETTESTWKFSKDEKKATGTWRTVFLKDCKLNVTNIYLN